MILATPLIRGYMARFRNRAQDIESQAKWLIVKALTSYDPGEVDNWPGLILHILSCKLKVYLMEDNIISVPEAAQWKHLSEEDKNLVFITEDIYDTTVSIEGPRHPFALEEMLESMNSDTAEWELVKALYKGYTQKEISSMLGIPFGSMESRITLLQKKMIRLGYRAPVQAVTSTLYVCKHCEIPQTRDCFYPDANRKHGIKTTKCRSCMQAQYREAVACG
jgi:hypothetical protein